MSIGNTVYHATSGKRGQIKTIKRIIDTFIITIQTTAGETITDYESNFSAKRPRRFKYC